MPTADDIIIDRAERDFDEGLAHARQRIRETHSRLAASALDTLLSGAISALGVRSRMKDDVRTLLDLAHRVAKGEDAHTLAAQHLDHILRLKQKMRVLADVDDPAFQQARQLALELFARRLPDLARMASVPAPSDYDDLVRTAFPERAHVDALVDDNEQSLHALIHHLEQNTHILRMPRSLAPKLAATAHDMITWKADQVRRGVQDIYATAPR